MNKLEEILYFTYIHTETDLYVKAECTVEAVSRDTYIYLLKFQCRRLSHRYVTYVSMRVNRNLVHTVRRSIVIALKYGIRLFNIKSNDRTLRSYNQ